MGFICPRLLFSLKSVGSVTVLAPPRSRPYCPMTSVFAIAAELSSNGWPGTARAGGQCAGRMLALGVEKVSGLTSLNDQQMIGLTINMSEECVSFLDQLRKVSSLHMRPVSTFLIMPQATVRPVAEPRGAANAGAIDVDGQITLVVRLPAPRRMCMCIAVSGSLTMRLSRSLTPRQPPAKVRAKFSSV